MEVFPVLLLSHCWLSVPRNHAGHGGLWEQVLAETEKAVSILAFPLSPVIKLSLPFMMHTWGVVRVVGAENPLGWKIDTPATEMLELTTVNCGCPLHSAGPSLKTLVMLPDVSPLFNLIYQSPESLLQVTAAGRAGMTHSILLGICVLFPPAFWLHHPPLPCFANVSIFQYNILRFFHFMLSIQLSHVRSKGIAEKA